jgi:hypothetical protein
LAVVFTALSHRIPPYLAFTTEMCNFRVDPPSEQLRPNKPKEIKTKWHTD